MALNISTHYSVYFNNNLITDVDTYVYSENLYFIERVSKAIYGIFQAVSFQFQASASSFKEAYNGKEIIRISSKKISPEQDLWIRALSDATPKQEFGFSARHAIEFIKRGGKVELVSEDNPMRYKEDEVFITGCHGGFNRSQLLASMLNSRGAKVIEVMAGGISAANPNQANTFFVKPSDHEKKVFQEALGHDRKPVLGFSWGNNPMTRLFRRMKFQNYFNNLQRPVHFAVFHSSASTAVQRLIARKGSLEGFTISFFPMTDLVQTPARANVQRESIEAFKDFEKILETHIQKA